uniref:Putative conserved secreted protein n=1 Tax=Culex tarsalis TaxID=7177 RepID=A0A1Q3FGK7_CULTA
MSVFFERFTLFCVITVITALSLIIVTSVQLAHEPEIVINRENGNLLDSLKSVRKAEGTAAVLGDSEKCPIPPDRVRLLVVVNSPKRNRKVRQTIRSTWAHASNLGVQVKFALTRSPEEQQSFIQRHLKHFSRRCVPADYLLITSDLFFINTPQITAAINQQLPRRSTIICAKADQHRGAGRRSEPKFLTDCDREAPVLISRDVVTAPNPDLKPHFGEHLYLSRMETAKILNGTIDGTDLLFFFSAQVANDASSSIKGLWMATRDYRVIES